MPKASGANSAIREVSGVFGVAVLASVFSHFGGYESPAAFVDGMTLALWIGAGSPAPGGRRPLHPRPGEGGSAEELDEPESLLLAARHHSATEPRKPRGLRPAGGNRAVRGLPTPFCY
jgi:hypothetical protein